MAAQEEETRFTAWCSCHAHHGLVVELLDWDGQWELSVGHTYEPAGSLWERIKGIWRWLRGRPLCIGDPPDSPEGISAEGLAEQHAAKGWGSLRGRMLDRKTSYINR